MKQNAQTGRFAKDKNKRTRKIKLAWSFLIILTNNKSRKKLHKSQIWSEN